ncbi:MAG: hypothetical protein J6N76_05475 [Lachnospiraceae bacterium]|nr:hypothetical protein [Lachnospiraceae bacterium]
MDESAFEEALKTAKIPILVLDQKWHRLFAISGKPEAVKTKEVELNELLQEQGRLNQEVKELKKLKNKLMADIVTNIDEADNAAKEKRNIDEDKRLIAETNDKLDEDEDLLLELPKRIAEKNRELMMLTMSFSYEKLRTNASEIDEITRWITNVRVELKKNIIKKQNREINNKEIYSYMHDIFGKDVLNMFDVKYDNEAKEEITEATPGVTAVAGKKEPAQKPTENYNV